MLIALPLMLSFVGVTAQPTTLRVLERYQSGDSRCLVYTNKQYGFTFCLPQSWRGFTVVMDRWDGRVLGGDTAALGPVIHGRELLIRHPLWTAAHPRQDIPIMVFTHAQWRLIQRETLAVSAAPIGPSRLGRNKAYVFALPARYNFAYVTGWREVQGVLEGHPLHPL